MFDLGLSSVHTLVTGASGGLGLELVNQFLAQDSLVTAHYNSNPAGLDSVASTSSLVKVKADVEKEDEVEHLFAQAREGMQGRAVEVLVVNHAYIALNDAPMSKMSIEQWNKTIGINLTGTFLLVRAFLNQLQFVPEDRKHKIAVVFVGSTAGLFGEAGHADYACSKSALMSGLALSLKNEIVSFAPRARVNVVAPGWIKTPAVASLLADPNVVYRALATTPLKKLAEPRDVATQVLALASETLSGHVTGQVVMVHGGMEGRLLNRESDIN